MEQDLQITEEFIMNKFKNDAERFEKRYGDYIEEAAKTYDDTYKSHGKTWGLHDTVALGQYMEQWEQYCQIAEADVTIEDVFAGSMPFFFLALMTLAILIAFPVLSTFLPGLVIPR